jgi:prepilin peptidase CpaA
MPYAWSAILTAAPVLLAAVALMVAAMHDIIARTVPNGLALLIALLGIIAHIADRRLLAGLAAGVIVFLIAAVCWRRGWLGGGDVKLLGAVAIVLPPAALPTFIVAMSVAGALQAAAYLSLRRIIPEPDHRRPAGVIARGLRAERWRILRGGPLPYACAIAAGFLFVLCRQGV